MIQNHQRAPDCLGDLVQIEQHSNTNQRLTVSQSELFNDRYRAMKEMRKNIIGLVFIPIINTLFSLYSHQVNQNRLNLKIIISCVKYTLRTIMLLNIPFSFSLVLCFARRRSYGSQKTVNSINLFLLFTKKLFRVTTSI